MFYVYQYSLNDIPFYIGMGHDDRINDHIREANRLRRSNRPLSKKYKIIIENIDAIKIEKLYENLTREEALELEIQLIKKIGRLDLGTGPLTNLTPGGDGVFGKTLLIHSETGEKVHILCENRLHYESMGYVHFNQGRKFSDEVNAKKGISNKGKKRPEHSIKIKEAFAQGRMEHVKIGKPHSDETKAKMRKPKSKLPPGKKRWYHSIQLNKEGCFYTTPDWPDLKFGRLPK